YFFFQAEDGIRDFHVTGVQTCALPIFVMTAQPTLTSENWPIATCMHGFAPVSADGTRMHDAEPEVWDDVFRQVQRLGFTAIEIRSEERRVGKEGELRRTLTRTRSRTKL